MMTDGNFTPEHADEDTELAHPAANEDQTVEYDCLACGRCCYQREGTILVTAADLLKWQRLRRFDILDGIGPGHFGQEAFQMAASTGACIHHGVPGSLHGCAIYPVRAEVCRSFEAGSPQCREYRRSIPR